MKLVDMLMGRHVRSRTRPLDDGSTLDVRCPRCAAQLRARCGRTNNCPRCKEKVSVPGADVARAALPLSGRELLVRQKLTGDDLGETRLPAPVLVIGYERPHYLVRVRGTQTAWVGEDEVTLVLPQPPTAAQR